MKTYIKLTAREAVALEAVLKAVKYELEQDKQCIVEVNEILDKLDSKLGAQGDEYNYTDKMAGELIDAK